MDGELLFIVKIPLGKKVDIRKQWISDFSFLMQLINSAQNIRIYKIGVLPLSLVQLRLNLFSFLQKKEYFHVILAF